MQHMVPNNSTQVQIKNANNKIYSKTKRSTPSGIKYYYRAQLLMNPFKQVHGYYKVRKK